MSVASVEDLSFKARSLTDTLPFPVLLYLMTVVVPIGFRVGPLSVTTLRLYLIAVIIPLTIRLLAGRYGKIVFPDVLFILHMLWAALALVANNPDQAIEQIGSVGAEFWGGYIIGRVFIRTPEAFIALCKWLFIIGLLILPLALQENFTGRAIALEMIRSIPGLDTVWKIPPDPRLGLFRAQTVFAHAIHSGLFFSVIFSLSFVALKGQMSISRRFIVSGLIGLGTFSSLSSGALLAIVLQLGLILWAAIFIRVRFRWWLLLALFVLAYVTIDLISNRTPIKVFMSYATFSAQNAYWRAIIFEWGMINVWANPFLGIGLNEWVRPAYMVSGTMDNFWLVMAVRYGIPGLLLLASGYVFGVVKVMRRNFEADPVLTYIRRAWVFTFLGLSFTLTTVHVWSNIYSFIFFMFGAGMWLTTTQCKPRTSPGYTEEEMPVSASRAGQMHYSRFPPNHQNDRT